MATSRPYKIQTKEVVGRTVVAEDHIDTRLDIPPLLPPARAAGILSNVLRSRQFTDDQDGRLTRERGGVTVTIDPASGSMRVSAEAEATLPPENPSPCACRAMNSLAQSRDAHNDLQRQVTERLRGSIARLGCEIEGVVHQVTVEAIKQKAAEMGRIKQVDEDKKTGALTVVVEV